VATKLALINDPRYTPFVKRYAFNLVRFAVEVCGMIPTVQQLEILRSVQDPSSRTSVSSGHGIGKTKLLALIGLWHMLCYPNSNTVLTAPKLKTVSEGCWKEFADLKTAISGAAQGWVAEYFEVQASKVYVKNMKLTWWIVPSTAPKGNPESLAGKHNTYLMFLVDEASGVEDASFGVITGALTGGPGNRMLLTSQPTRGTGFFYNTHHELSKEEGGVWTALQFSSIDSILVSDDFIIEKKAQYTEDEWAIKVLGEFRDLAGKYLIGADAIRKCKGRNVIKADEAYGWFTLNDIGGGGYRDDTVMLSAKVIGEGEYGEDARRVQITAAPIVSNSKDPSDFYGDIIEEGGRLSNSMAQIDGGGIGLTVIKQLEKNGFTAFNKIMWGAPNFKIEFKERYVNQRAQATCGLARAISEGRVGFDESVPETVIRKIIKQGSKIPYFYDEKARRYLMSKKEMAAEGLPSPDVFDALAFAFIESAHFNEADGTVLGGTDDGTEKARARAAIIAALEAAETEEVIEA